MNSDDTLLLRALQLKELKTTGSSHDLVSEALRQDPDAFKDKMRNICALVSTGLFEEVEEVCTFLSLSKRQFVEMAIVDLLEKANKTLDDTGLNKTWDLA